MCHIELFALLALSVFLCVSRARQWGFFFFFQQVGRSFRFLLMLVTFSQALRQKEYIYIFCFYSSLFLNEESDAKNIFVKATVHPKMKHLLLFSIQQQFMVTKIQKGQQKYHKSSPCELCALFQVFVWETLQKTSFFFLIYFSQRKTIWSSAVKRLIASQIKVCLYIIYVWMCSDLTAVTPSVIMATRWSRLCKI